MNEYIVNINTNTDQIYNYIYAQSAWYASFHEGVKILTYDNRKMLGVKIREGLNDFRQRFSGYMTFCLYNEAIIYTDFKFKHEPSYPMQDAIHEMMVYIIGNFVLMKYYGENDVKGHEYGKSIFYIEWRRYMAKMMLSFAKDAI